MKIIILITVFESLALGLWIMIRWHSRKRRSRARASLRQLPVLPATNDLTLNAVSASFAAARRACINEWHVEGQANDRRPMRVGVVNSAGSRSARRSAARQSHQMMYKEWSQARHD